MRKLLLLLAGSFSIIGANAQYIRNNSMLFANPAKGTGLVTNNAANKVKSHHAAAKTTAVTIASENFGSGTSSSLPTGWTTGGTGSWHWTNSAPTGTYSAGMGTMSSTTASNGWMLFDADATGAGCSCAPTAWLQSPAYNCTSHTTVRLNFEDYFEEFNDSCFVYVSTSPTFSSYTVFPVKLNNSLAPNSFSANAATVHINISSAAAGQPAVYIRFVYVDDAGQTGGYAWMVDDMSLTELNAHDVSLEKSFVFEGEPTGACYPSSIFTTPKEYVDSISPVTQLSNEGANAETAVMSTAKIYQGASTTPVYTQNSTIATLPVGTSDTFVQFPNYLPNAVDNYVVTFKANLANDSDMSNNTDTVLFAVSDTTWMPAQGQISGGFYVHNPTASPAVSFFQGARFDVPPGSPVDTISGFAAAFESSSLPTGTGTVSIQLYSINTDDSTSWTYVGSSLARSLTAADISTSSSAVWANFQIDPTSVASYVLQPGNSYAAVIQINNVTTNLVVLATAASSITGTNAGYFGQSDASNDDGGTNFGFSTIATGIPDAVPLVRLYFGNVPVNHTAVNNISLENNIGAAYPDPANTSVNIPFTMAMDANVTITLTDVIGQVVTTQTVHAAGGQYTKGTIATSNLSDGVYIYTVTANGQSTTGRIVIAH